MDLKKSALDNFTQRASEYQNHAQAQEWMAQNLFLLIEKNFATPSSNTFEVGAGTGILSRKLAPWMKKGRLEIQDISLAMLFQNQMQMQALAQGDKSFEKLSLHFEQGDLSARSWPNCCELICGSAVIQWVPDFVELLKQQVKQCASGCTFAFNTLTSDCFEELQSSYKQSFAKEWSFPIYTYSEEYWREELLKIESIESLKIEVNEKTFYFDSLKDLLLEFKQNGTQGEKNRLEMTPSQYKKWNTEYQKVDAKLPLSWKTISFSFLKK